MRCKRIKWDITSACNMRCLHCCVGKKYFLEKSGEIPPEQKIAIIDKLVEGGVGQITLLGGEPLTMGKTLISIIEYAKSKDVRVSLASNGLLLSNQIMKKIAESGLDSISISLEGSSIATHEYIRGANTFQRLIDNIFEFTHYIHSRGIPLHVNINTVLNRSNSSELNSIIDLCIELSADQWTLLSLGCIGFADDNRSSLSLSAHEELEAAKTIAQRYSCHDHESLSIQTDFYPLVHDYIKEKYNLTMPQTPICCDATTTLGYIGPDGKMYPCDRFSESSYAGMAIEKTPIRPKSLLTSSFLEIWNSDLFVSAFKFIQNEKTYGNYNPCNRCKHLKSGFCNPCPLPTLKRSRINIETCQVIENELGNISDPVEERSFWKAPTESIVQLERQGGNGRISIGVDSSIPVKTLGVRSIEKENYLMIYNPNDSESIWLNAFGSLIWHFIDSRNTIDEICNMFIEIISDVRSSILAKSIEDEEKTFLYRQARSFIKTLDQTGFIGYAKPILTCGSNRIM